MEVGLITDKLKEYTSKIDYGKISYDLEENNSSILEIEIYDVYGNNLTKGKDVDEIEKNAIEKIISSGQGYSIINNRGLPEREYILVEPYNKELESTDKIISIKYNYEALNGQLKRSKEMTFIISIISIFLSSVFIWIVLTKYLTNPIIEFSNDLQKKTFKEILDEFKEKDYSRNEFGKLITSFRNLSMDLNQTLISNVYLENVIESLGDIVVVCDLSLKITKVNNLAIKILGYEREALLGKKISDIFEFHDDYGDFEKYIEEKNFIKNYSISIRKFDGRYIPALSSVTLVKNELNESLNYIFNSKDMTESYRQAEELKNLNEKLIFEEKLLRDMAIKDGLTKIFNRTHGLKILDELIENKLDKISLAMIDIDFFKNINDDFGHLAGDMVLIELTGLIGNLIDNSWIFARYGGEEFIIVMPNVEIEEAASKMEEIRIKISQKYFRKVERQITVSIGVSQYKGGGSKKLLKESDRLLYKAKVAGKNRVVSD